MTSELDDGWEEFDEDSFDDGRSEDAARAALDPAFDYFEAHRPDQPKAEIGRYVLEQGFRVPLITEQSGWEAACDEGTAMLRSEMRQDYDGLSGLLTSERLAHSIYNQVQGKGFVGKFGRLVMQGLRSGELGGTEYMRYLRAYLGWTASQCQIVKTAMYFGAEVYLDEPTASRWRYIEGANVTVFADPHVEGRYHFGVTPAKQHPNDYQMVGGYQVEPGEHDKPQHFRKHKQPFIARPFIEFYEQIRTLPYFDSTQNPVLELQQDAEGNIWFLQYLKTNQPRVFLEPCDVPRSNEALRLTNVRGITSPKGTDMRLYMAPNLLTKGMEGQGIFFSLTWPRDLEAQFASRAAGFVLHEAYISFQDNHFDSSPLYRPPLAAGLTGCHDSPPAVLRKVEEIIEQAIFHRPGGHLDRTVAPYLDIKVTSNGREAAIESDWTLKMISYDDI